MQVHDADGKDTFFEYYGDGRLYRTITPVSTGVTRTTTWTYDDLLRTTTITDHLGHVTVLTYDDLGRLTGREDPLHNLTSYTYTNLGRRETVTHPDTTVRRWEYDCCGVWKEWDELGRLTGKEHDELNRLWQVWDKSDTAHPRLLTEYGYNDDGTRHMMKDVLQRQTTYGYDNREWLTDIEYPDATHDSFTYFKDHDLKTKTDRISRTTTFAHDLTGRLSLKTYPDNSTVSFTYTPTGSMETATVKNPGGVVQSSVTSTYTPTGRLETSTQTLYGVSKTFRYSYFDDGSLHTFRDETSNRTTTYAYYGDGRLYTITDPNNEVFTFEYNNDGSLKKTYPTGVYTSYAYHSRGWLLSMQHKDGNKVLAKYFFTDGTNDYYDDVGNRQAMDSKAGHHAYGYDFYKGDRLLTATHPDSSAESYGYDEAGNRTTSAEYTNWTYDAQNDELDSYDAVSFTHDGNGNRATRTEAGGTSTYTYDYENRLIRVDYPGGYATYAYDALGRRVRKVVNGTVRLFWYDREDMVLETDGAGVEVARYTHGPGVDAPLKVRRGGKSYYYHEDGLGSIILITDDRKKEKNSYVYNAFGQMVTQVEGIVNPYTYTGREWDAESGLYYYRARHYDPRAGRFLQADPLPPRPEEMNRYVYVLNNPITLKDPSGLSVECEIGCLAIFTSEMLGLGGLGTVLPAECLGLVDPYLIGACVVIQIPIYIDAVKDITDHYTNCLQGCRKGGCGGGSW